MNEAERGWRWHCLVATSRSRDSYREAPLNGTLYPLDMLRRCRAAFRRSLVRYNPAAPSHDFPYFIAAGSIAGYLTDPQPHAEGVSATLVLLRHQDELRRRLLEDYALAEGEGWAMSLAISMDFTAADCTWVESLLDGHVMHDLARITFVDIVACPASSARFLYPLDEREDPSMSAPSTTPEEDVTAALAVVKQLHDDEQRLDEQHQHLAASQDVVRASAGQAVLAALHGERDGAGAAVTRATRVDAELRAIEDAIQIVRDRRRAAIAAVSGSQRAVSRAQAAVKREELVAHGQQVTALLAQLLELEGSPYIPSRVFEHYAYRAGAAVTWSPETRTERLRTELADFEERGRQEFGPRPVGVLKRHTAHNLKELVLQTTMSALNMGPTRGAVRAWARDVDPAGLATRYDVVWRDGELVPEQCRVELATRRQQAA